MLDRASNSSRMILSKIKDLYPRQTFHTVIEMDGTLKEAQILNMPAIHYNQQSIAGKQYIGLTKEIISNVDDSSLSAP
jgi:cellulose biosynthesis protein BcsQ